MRKIAGLIAVRLAGPVGTVVRFAVSAGPGLAGLLLVSFGAWLAWPPAGFMVAGSLILTDLAYTRTKGRSE